MATFAKATFDAAVYASYRPTYPKRLFDFIFKYHESTKGARWDTAVDIGCGTGQATAELTPFKRVVGVDPSAKMIEVAKQLAMENAQSTNSENVNQFEYIQSEAENLSFLKDGSVDLLISAQAAHWFDWSKVWPETARVLRKGGSVAVWIYSEFRITRHPNLTPLITAYAQGSDPANSLGPHWQQPGRSILDNHLVEIPSATDVLPDQFENFERVFFTGRRYPPFPSARSVILRKKMTWNDLQQYFRTWSSLHTYHERYPEDLTHPEGDIAVRFWKSLKDGVDKDEKPKDNDLVEIEWPLALILVKKA
jgi:SAM-dependent methyltransferase